LNRSGVVVDTRGAALELGSDRLDGLQVQSGQLLDALQRLAGDPEQRDDASEAGFCEQVLGSHGLLTSSGRAVTFAALQHAQL
jgi:hypothetical protein